MLVVVILHKRG